jgi:hypothetical protein
LLLSLFCPKTKGGATQKIIVTRLHVSFVDEYHSSKDQKNDPVNLGWVPGLSLPLRLSSSSSSLPLPLPPSLLLP